MGRRKKPYQKQMFESTGVSSDTSANIYESMMLSRAWKELTPSQKVLYMTCKSQYYSEKRKPEDNREYFTMNKEKWAGKYELYAPGSGYSFGRDMAALITHGFVACVYADRSPTTKNIYRFSSMWQWYGTARFQVTKDDWTTHMWNEYSKKIRGEKDKKRESQEEGLVELRQTKTRGGDRPE